MNKIIIANMKMNLDKTEIINYLKELEKENLDNVIFCPTSIYIPYFIDKKINVGIQDISKYEKGNHTGEISCMQAKSLGVKYAIIGHSEIKDKPKTINKKIKLCKKNNIIPILCVGERKKSIYKEQIVKRQLKNYLKNISLDKIIIAYEPKFMVNSENKVNVKYIEKMIKYIKNIVKNYKVNDIMVLYGGNTNKENIKLMTKIKELDGFLVGRTSLDVKKFKELIEVAVF